MLAGELSRLMVFAPPQHGKSELVSVRFPVFWLAHRPDDPVMITSYGSSLASDKSGQGRAVIESPQFRCLFPECETDRESRSRDRWRLKGHRGGIIAAGVGGPITGHGAALGIIDDPIENWEQAQSQTYRDKTWDWYRATFRTRIWEGGAIVLIMTRWHEDDLAGRLLNDQAGQWTVVRLPAIAEAQDERDEGNRLCGLEPGLPDPLGRKPGEPLSPERFSIAALRDIQRDVGRMAWYAEYQGTPRAAEGNLFQRSWFPIVNVAPVEATRVRYWDKAGTENAGNYTAGVLMARDDNGLYFVEDVVRGQWSSHQRNTVIKQTAHLDAEKYGNTVQVWVEREGGSGGKESAEMTVKDLAGFPIRTEQVTGSKEVRAAPFAAQAEAGNVRLVRGPWNQEYLNELTVFPSGQYDDQVDGSSGAFNKLARPYKREARSYQG